MFFFNVGVLFQRLTMFFLLLFFVSSFSEGSSVANAIASKVVNTSQIEVSEKKATETQSPSLSEKQSLDINDVESGLLEDINQSAQDDLAAKEKNVSETLIEHKKVLEVRENSAKKARALEAEIEQTKKQITQSAETDKSAAEITQLKKKSKNLQQQYQLAQKELQKNNKKAENALKISVQQQDEIENLKKQLHQIDIEKNKRQSPRKKALILVVIILLTTVILFAKNYLASKLEIWFIARKHGGKSARALRFRTMLRISNWGVSVLLVGIAIFMVLELFGFDSTTTLAGAGVFSVAIGFGAQQFIKDIFSGLFLVMEGQYGVNDFVSLGKYSGTVEDINLRFTKLRNYDGTIIYIPNGDIHSVINHGKDYSYSVINFYVDVQQNIDQVFALTRKVVSELKQSADLSAIMLGEVELLGINEFTPTGIEIKFKIKTRTQEQWQVGREVRLALKQRFDLEGIQLYQYAPTLALVN